MDEIVANPSVLTIISVNSPRRFDSEMTDGLMAMAEHGQPAVVTPFTLMGAMTPVTLAAALVQQNAEALAGIALTQLVRPGAPVVYGAFTSNVDLRSGAPAFGTPENARATIAAGQLARRYGIPYRASNASASNALDAQAAYESQMSIWSSVLGGAHLVYHGAGWMEGGLTASFEKIVLDVEMLQMIALTIAPAAVDEAEVRAGLDSDRRRPDRRALLRLAAHARALRERLLRAARVELAELRELGRRGLAARRGARDGRLAGGARALRAAAARRGRGRGTGRVRQPAAPRARARRGGSVRIAYVLSEHAGGLSEERLAAYEADRERIEALAGCPVESVPYEAGGPTRRRRPRSLGLERTVGGARRVGPRASPRAPP